MDDGLLTGPIENAKITAFYQVKQQVLTLFTAKLRSHLIVVRACLFEGLDQHTGCTVARLVILTCNQVPISLQMIGPSGLRDKIGSQFA